MRSRAATWRSATGSNSGHTRTTATRWTRRSASWSAIRAASSSATPTRSWPHRGQLNDRELPGGGTPAQRYARLAGLTDSERAIAARIASARLALLRVRSTEPGRAIEIEDVSRGGARVGVVSHEVSSHVQTNDMFVGRLMPGPPSASLWGHMAMLDRRGGRELIDLLEERIALLGLRTPRTCSARVRMKVCGSLYRAWQRARAER